MAQAPPVSAPHRNLAEMFFAKAAARANRPRHQVKRDGQWRLAFRHANNVVAATLP